MIGYKFIQSIFSTCIIIGILIPIITGSILSHFFYSFYACLFESLIRFSEYGIPIFFHFRILKCSSTKHQIRCRLFISEIVYFHDRITHPSLFKSLREQTEIIFILHKPSQIGIRRIHNISYHMNNSIVHFDIFPQNRHFLINQNCLISLRKSRKRYIDKTIAHTGFRK